MISVTTFFTFIIVIFGLFLIPGPAVVLTVTNTIKGNRKSGIMTALGIAIGDLIHTIFAGVGLSTILMSSALAFNIIKYLGAAYLIYLGIQSIFEKQKLINIDVKNKEISSSYLKKAVFIEVLNPKTALFFLAFLPQFVSIERGATLLQFLILGLIFAVAGFLYTTVIALSVNKIKYLFKGESILSRWTGKIVGTIYISLGLKVAFEDR